MRQVFDFSFNVGGTPLPKFALFDKQAKTAISPARAMWVDDPRAALRNHFNVTFCVTATGQKYTMCLDVKTSPIARRFHKFAQELPRENLQAPIRVVTYKDVCATAPRDRRAPQPFLKGAYTPSGKVSAPVTEGCRIGAVKVKQEGYNKLRLNLDVEL